MSGLIYFSQILIFSFIRMVIFALEVLEQALSDKLFIMKPVTSQEDGSTGFLFVLAHLLTGSRVMKVIQPKSLIDPVRRSC